MASAWAAAAGLVLTMALAVACSRSTEAPTPVHTLPSHAPTVALTPGPTEDAHVAECLDVITRAEHPRLGRQLTEAEVGALSLRLRASHGRATGAVFSDGAHDFGCFIFPDEDSTVFTRNERLVWGHDRLATHLSDELPVVAANAGGGFPGPSAYTWGAVGPGVARLTVTVAGGQETDTLDAPIQNGYFTALFYGTSNCCVFTLIAYDSSGAEIYRSP